MIEFHTLEVCNVGTYKGEHSLRLDNPGFNLILGKSGAGKSTLFRTLSFLLYGVVEGSGAQRAKGDLIHAARRSGIRAAVSFTADGIKYVAEWRYKHEGVTGRFLTQGGLPWSGYTERDTLDRIQGVLQMTYTQFLTSVYLPQRGSSIIVSGSSADRWRYIATLSDTDSLDLLAERINERLQGYASDQGKADAWAEHKAELQAELESTGGDKRALVALKAHHRRTLALHEKRRSSMEAVVAAHKAAKAVERERAALESSMVRPAKPEGLDAYTRDSARAARSGAREVLDRKIKRAKALETLAKLEAPERESSKLSEAQDRLSAKLAKIRADLHYAKERLEGIEAQQASGVCSACERPFENHDAEGLAEQAKAAQRKINKLSEKGRKLKAQAQQLREMYQAALTYEQWKARVDDIEPVTEEQELEAQHVLEATEQWAETYRVYTTEFAAYKRTKAAIEALPDVQRPEVEEDAALYLIRYNAGKANSARNALSKIESALDSISDLEDRIAKADEKIREVQRRLRRAGVLEQMLEAVRDARQGRIEAVTKLLTQLASKHYPDANGATFTADLGSRKFDILLHRTTSEGKAYSLSTRQLSGGELDMATIAFMFAVQELATSRIQSNLLVLDEAAAHMDDDGWDLLLDRLRVGSAGKAVFVVSHRRAANEAQVWDHIVHVKKIKGDSTLTVRR